MIPKQPKILVLGNGQIGKAINAALRGRTDYEVVSLKRTDLNYRSYTVLQETLENLCPQYIINCVAYTDVAGAEKKENIADCVDLNTILPLRLANLSMKMRARFIHFSTDYVFNGKKTTPYTEKDNTNPLNFYGSTKDSADVFLERKRHIKIFRVQCVYDNHSKNFVSKVEKSINGVHTLDVVDDQITVPTHASWIADVIIPLIPDTQHGMWNLCPEGQVSYADFARKIVDGRCNINSVKTADFSSSVTRPLYSVMDNSKIKKDFNLSFPTWEEVYDQYKM